MTPAALRNASVVLQATSGSTNALVHLAAIAGRAGLAFDLAEFDRVGRDVPVLVNLKPAGHFFIEDFHAGGGVPALWRRLRDTLDLTARTVSGETLGDIVARWPAYVDDEVIRPLDKPIFPREAIAILSGNLAPQGAAIKLASATPRSFACIRDRRWCSTRSTISTSASTIRHLPVTPDHVMVLRNAGPIGAPGMPEAGALPIPKKLGSERRHRHGAHFRCAHERHGVRHRRAARDAGSRRRRTAGAGARRRPSSGSTPMRGGSIFWSTRPSSRAGARPGRRRKSPRAATRGSMSSA